jgi:hypothetical protein
MRKIIFLSLFALIISVNSYAQFGDILKKATDKVAKVELFEEKNVTTSIEDALPVAFWLKDLSDYDEPVEQDNYNFSLTPGYYKFVLQSYCLKAGTHGPTKGSGYLLAPLKGKRSDIVYNVITNSSNHPEIEQHDIQVFLWGIIAGTKFTDYSLEFQNKIRPLLTPAEMTDLSLDIMNVPLDVMPDDIKSVAKFYQDFRAKITNPNTTYNELESMAMLNGVLPDDPFSKYVQKGLWAYIGDGFYGRSMPQGYQKTIHEIYRPAKVNATKDSKGRLTMLENDGNKIEIFYDDEPGRDVVSFSGQGDYPVWRFKSIKLSSDNGLNETTLENTGWIVKDKGLVLKKSGSDKYETVTDEPMYSDYLTRMNNAKRTLTDFDDYRKQKQMQPLKDKQDEAWADYHTLQGLKAATNPLDKKGQMNWIEKTLKLTMDWWNNSSSALAGEENTDNSNHRVDFKKTPAVPATNGMQRIISSERHRTE